MLSAAPARADGHRPLHGFVGVGGDLTAVGSRPDPTIAPTLQIEVLPGSAFGRYGVRADIRWRCDAAPTWLMGGIAYEAAASRPRLQISLHGTAGVIDEAAAIAAGATAHLGIVGPLAVGLDGSAALRFPGGEPRLLITTALVVGIAR